MPASRRLQLSGKLDQIISFSYGDDDEKPKRKIGGIPSLAAVSALYGIGSMAKSPGGLGYTGRETIANAGKDLSKIGRGGLGNITSTIGRGYDVSANAVKTAAPKARKAIGTLGDRIASTGALRTGNAIASIPRVTGNLARTGKSSLSALLLKLRNIKLSSRLDGIIEFKEKDDPKKKNRLQEALKEKLDKKRKGRKSRAGALSTGLDEILEFKTPWVEVNETEKNIRDRENAKLRAAKLRYKAAKNTHFKNTYLSPELLRAHEKFNRESYSGRGMAIGAPAGAVAGVGAGVGLNALLNKALKPIIRNSHTGPAILGGLEGAALGAGAGLAIGGRIRRKDTTKKLSSALDDIIAFKAIDLGYTYGSDMCASPCDEPRKKHYPSLYVSDQEKEVNLPISGEAKVKFRLRGKTSRTDETGKTKHSADIEIQSIDPVTDDKKPKEGGKAKLLGLSVTEFGARDLATKAALFGYFNKGKIATGTGLGAGYLLHRHRRLKKKTDQGGTPGDTPGSTSELSAKLDELLMDADPRPRNKLGEYSGQEETTVDPNAVHIVYGQQKKKGLHNGVAEGAASGLGGATSALAVKALFDKIKKAKK